MKHITVRVTCTVEPKVAKATAKHTVQEFKDAVHEAIEEALHYAEKRGLYHSLDEQYTIVIQDVDTGKK